MKSLSQKNLKVLAIVIFIFVAVILYDFFVSLYRTRYCYNYATKLSEGKNETLAPNELERKVGYNMINHFQRERINCQLNFPLKTFNLIILFF